MQEQLSAGSIAAKKFKEGYNCAESVLRALNESLNLKLSDDALKMATGFGGGLGHAGCICGALSGAIMAVNSLQGRTGADQSRDPVYASVKELHDLFTETNGASCCRLLKPGNFNTVETKRNCLQLTANTADLAYKLIKDKNLA